MTAERHSQEGAASLVLVTGATGYIGGRLVPRLLEAGYAVRCLVRSPRKLTDRPWASDQRVEIRQADLLHPEGLTEAMRGCAAAYYLVHSVGLHGAESLRADRVLAGNFAEAAEGAGVGRIVCLGALGDVDGRSGPLASRAEVEAILRARRTPVTILRAAMILGSGSAAFEILRYLVERLPVMVTPRWVASECQPIAVRDVLDYLVRTLSVPETAGRTLEIGGPEVVTYLDLMRIMAEEGGLPPRFVIRVPVLAPRLSALWIHLITPIGYRTAAPLVEGLRERLVCGDEEASRLMPLRRLPVREAIRLAFVRVREGNVGTTWSSAGRIPGDPDWSGGTAFADQRWRDVAVSPAAAFRAVCRIGGPNGWYAGDRLWRLRGALDRLVGGPGLRRGRRHPEDLVFGEAVDFWRVTGLVRNRALRLRAEMRVPGVAELEFEIEPRDAEGRLLPAGADDGARRCRIRQTARFLPLGLSGLAYWYAMLPFHALLFSRMLEGIRLAAERIEAAGEPSGTPLGDVARGASRGAASGGE